MKYFFVVGEASGDLHTSRVMNALKRRDPSAHFAYMGGAKMRSEGGECVVASETLAYMGFLDVAKHLSQIRYAGRQVQQAIIDFAPDVVVCTDYASFCFRYILPFVRKHLPRTRIAYFIPPKVWAWKKGRVKRLAGDTDLVLCILPFEVDFLQKNGVRHCEYIGNPSYEEVQEFLTKHTPKNSPPYIALLPGSRASEVRQNLPLMSKVAGAFPDLDIKIAATSHLSKETYGDLLNGTQLVWDEAYSVVQGATAALVTSGTATLETALLDTPQVVCYAHRMGVVSNYVFEHFFSVPFISLVNLIAGREVVPELFGGNFKGSKILDSLAPLTLDSKQRHEMLRGYADVRSAVATPIPSSHVTADALINLASK